MINKSIYLLSYPLLLLLISSLVSCTYEKTKLSLGSQFDETWSFTNGNIYTYNSKLININNGRAELKAIDLNNTGVDFSLGSHIGSALINDQLTVITGTEADKDLRSIYPELTSSLVSYWKFEGNANDETPNNHHLALANSPTYSKHAIVDSYSTNIDGSAFYSLAEPPYSNNSNLTFNFWYKTPNVNGSTQGLLSSPSTWLPGRVWIRVGDNGVIRTNVYFGTDCDFWANGPRIDDNKWHMISYSLDTKGLATSYVDGVAYASENIKECFTSWNTNGSAFTIGATTGTPDYGQGFIDEFAIINKALTSSEIKNIYNQQFPAFADNNELHPSWTPHYNKLAAYWKMDGDWDDYSGNEHHGTKEGAGASSFISPGQIGAEMGEFDGVDDRINIGDVLDLENSAITLSSWIYPRSYTGFAGLINKFFSGGNYGLTFNSDGQIYFRISDGIIIEGLYSGTALDLNQWYHVVVTHDNNQTARIYIDGQIAASKEDFTLTRTSNTTSLTLAYNSNNSNSYFHGSMDDVAIWQTDLSPSDVNLIYNRQKQKYAAHYESDVFDLGSTLADWPDFSWTTHLPFSKGLVGDFNNDGFPDADASFDYSQPLEDLTSGLVAYWPLQQDTQDYSGSNRHATLIATNGHYKRAQWGYSRYSGLGERINVAEPLSPNFNLNTTIAFWIRDSNSEPVYRGYLGKLHTHHMGWMIQKNNAQKLGIRIDTNGTNLPDQATCNIDPLCNQNVYSTSNVTDGQWHHYVVQFSENTNDPSNSPVAIYVNGQLELSSTFQYGNGINVSTANFDLKFSVVDVELRELAIWNKTLSANEIRQLYQRGANRVKLQFKSCADEACNCTSFNTLPVGNSNDCDGDGIINTADNNDIFKAHYIGPGGDGTTYYSESLNRSFSNIIFNCALNTTDSDSSICMNDEISLTGTLNPTAPEFINSDYSQFVTPNNNRYFKYKAYLEANGNTACDGSPCIPSLSMVNFNLTNAVKYASEPIEIKPNTSINFSKLISINIEAQDCASFRLGRSGNSYYHDSASWVLATAKSHINTQEEVKDHILQFATQYGPGELQVISYLQSDPTQTQKCYIESVDVIYE